MKQGSYPLDYIPGPGEIWVCAACGRTWKTRLKDAGDTSCVLWGNLCKADSVVYADNGRAVKADTIPDE